MRRFTTIGSMLLVLVAVVLVTRGFGAAAHQSTDGTATSGFVGSWRVIVTPADGPSFPVMSSYMADGTTLHDGLPAQPAVPGAPYEVSILGTGHGVWEVTGENTSAMTFELLNSEENGNYLGRLTISGAQELGADGDTFTGEYVVTVTDPAGNVIATTSTTAVGTRMRVEQPARPARPTSGRFAAYGRGWTDGQS